MYESPIKVLCGEMQTEIENDLLVKCSQAVGYDIDKDELIKALKYDREQYEKGYSDGLNADKWISVDEKLPDTMNDCLVWYSCDTAFGKSKSVGISFCLRGDWYTKKLDGDNIVVLYWQYLPDYPKE